jgi:hypothetical protein
MFKKMSLSVVPSAAAANDDAVFISRSAERAKERSAAS